MKFECLSNETSQTEAFFHDMHCHGKESSLLKSHISIRVMDAKERSETLNKWKFRCWFYDEQSKCLLQTESLIISLNFRLNVSMTPKHTVKIQKII